MANVLSPCLLPVLLLLAPALSAPHERGLIFNLVRGMLTRSLPQPGDAPSAAMGRVGGVRGALVSGSSYVGEPRGDGCSCREQNLLWLGKLRQVGMACCVFGGWRDLRAWESSCAKGQGSLNVDGIEALSCLCQRGPPPWGARRQWAGGTLSQRCLSPIPVSPAETSTSAGGILGQTEEMLQGRRLGGAGSRAEPQPKGRAGV